jgi:hypothetical protein
MRLTRVFTVLYFLAAAGGLSLGGQVGEEPRARPDPLFIRATVYPTWSLSRYDFNNDLDMVEIRAYVELRRRGQEGPILRDARVEVNGKPLEFKDDSYEKRIEVPTDALPETISLRIIASEEQAFFREVPVPDWLVITAPEPSILEGDGDLDVAWKFRRNQAAVNVRVYDFKSGTSILQQDDLLTNRITIPAGDLPRDTTLRIYVIGSWFQKKYLAGADLARGSEIIIMPWSQVFVRTR